MTNMKNTEAKTDELAGQVLSGEALDSFRKLDLASKLLGIRVLAHLGGDMEMGEAVQAVTA